MQRNRTILTLIVGAVIGVLATQSFNVGVAAYRQSLDDQYNEGFIAGSEDMHQLQVSLDAEGR